MNRRDLLKAIPGAVAIIGAPLVVKGKDVGAILKVDPQAKYLVFFDAEMVDAEAICNDTHCPLPPGTPLYSVLTCGDKTIDDAIRIYEVKP